MPDTDRTTLGVYVLPINDENIRFDFYPVQDGQLREPKLSSVDWHTRDGTFHVEHISPSQHHIVSLLETTDMALTGTKINYEHMVHHLQKKFHEIKPSLSLTRKMNIAGGTLNSFIFCLELPHALESKQPVEAVLDLSTRLACSIVGAEVCAEAALPTYAAGPLIGSICTATATIIGGALSSMGGEAFTQMIKNLNQRKDPMTCLDLKQCPVTHPVPGTYLASLVKPSAGQPPSSQLSSTMMNSLKSPTPIQAAYAGKGDEQLKHLIEAAFMTSTFSASKYEKDYASMPSRWREIRPSSPKAQSFRETDKLTAPTPSKLSDTMTHKPLHQITTSRTPYESSIRDISRTASIATHLDSPTWQSSATSMKQESHRLFSTGTSLASAPSASTCLTSQASASFFAPTLNRIDRIAAQNHQSTTELLSRVRNIGIK